MFASKKWVEAQIRKAAFDIKELVSRLFNDLRDADREETIAIEKRLDALEEKVEEMNPTMAESYEQPEPLSRPILMDNGGSVPHPEPYEERLPPECPEAYDLKGNTFENLQPEPDEEVKRYKAAFDELVARIRGNQDPLSAIFHVQFSGTFLDALEKRARGE